MDDHPSISAKSGCFPGNLLSSLKRLRCDGKFCDVTIKCDDTEFRAHKTVLASATEYFEAMFSNETKEARTGIVDFSHVPIAVVKQTLEFIYSGNVEISVVTVKELLNLSEMIQLKELAALCVEFLAESISMENCSEMISLSNLHCKEVLSDKIRLFLTKHFEEFIKNDAFKLLDISCLLHCLDLLQSAECGETFEVQKWNAILSWINHDMGKRNDQIFKLFKTVDLSCLSQDFVKDNVLSQPLILECNECLALVALSSVSGKVGLGQMNGGFNGFVYFESNSQMIVRYDFKSDRYLSPIAFPWKLPSDADVISHQDCIYVGTGACLYQFCNGKWNVTPPKVNYVKRDVECESCGSMSSRTVEHLPNPCYCRCVGIGDSIYMVTCKNVYQCSTSDLKLEFYELPVTLAVNFFIAASEDKIYIMGIWNPGLAYVFDASTKICSRISNHFCYYHGVAVWFDHRIFTFRYDKAGDKTSLLFVYDINMDCWASIPEIKTDGVAENCYITDKLYLTGKSHEDIRGQVDLQFLKSIKVMNTGKRYTRITG